jgi:RND family efflux transporter MFP subunit
MTDLLPPKWETAPADDIALNTPIRRRNPWWLIITLMVAMIVLGGGYWYLEIRGVTPTAAATAAPPPPATVTVAKPLIKEIVEWDEFTGQFAAVDSVEIRSRVSGYLDSIHFTDGQMVTKGDPLFVIDPRPFEISLASAEAALASAKARVNLAQQQLDRAEKLKKSDFVSQSTFDERLEELQTASADAEVAAAAINSAKLNLAYTRIAAPLSGRVGVHEVSIGNLVTGGESGNTTRLTTLVSLDPIHLTFDVSESDFLAYQRAAAEGRLQSTRETTMEVAAHLMDEETWSLQGQMDFVNNEVDRTAGTIRARAIFANPGNLITPGQFGRIRIPGSDPYDAVLIPDSAILSDQSEKIVMTVTLDGTVVPKVIRPGPSYDGLRIVREGLTADDTIIIGGLLRARPGGKVDPKPGEIKLAVTQ